MALDRPSRASIAPLAHAAAALAPLVAWGIHIALLQRLAHVICGPPVSGWFYATTILLLTVMLVSGWISLRGYRTAADAGKARREAIAARYFGMVGVIAALLFGAGILGQTFVFRAACLA